MCAYTKTRTHTRARAGMDTRTHARTHARTHIACMAYMMTLPVRVAPTVQTGVRQLVAAAALLRAAMPRTVNDKNGNGMCDWRCDDV